MPFLTPADLALASDPTWVPCCWGSSLGWDPSDCTCWRPVYDLEQAEPSPATIALLAAGIEPVTRAQRCHDCAFRPDSPERARGDRLEALPNFWCHQGIRRPVAYRHPDGRERAVDDSADYQPPIISGVPWRADGTPAERCAGHAQARRLVLA